MPPATAWADVLVGTCPARAAFTQLRPQHPASLRRRLRSRARNRRRFRFNRFRSRRKDRIRDLHHHPHVPHIMDAHYVGAAQDARRHRGRGGELRLPFVGLRQERLARGPHQYRQFQLRPVRASAPGSRNFAPCASRIPGPDRPQCGCGPRRIAPRGARMPADPRKSCPARL